MFRKKQLPSQQTLWISTREIAAPRTLGFYQQLEAVLKEHRIAENVRELCQPYYTPGTNGAPGIDPMVYFKMLLVGFFENLTSERSIASRCEDSLSIRLFLGYSLTERTPEHSWLTVMRKRLPEEIYRAFFDLLLDALRKGKLLKGKHLGIDTTVIEANASLKSLKNRMTQESYWKYVKRLAAAAGVDTADADAVRRFDRKRKGKKMSNKEWMNPHDPDARIGQTKDGATDMIYKAEHVVDMETGAIVDARTMPGDQADTDGLSDRVLEAREKIDERQEEAGRESRMETITMDKGYYSIEENKKLQAAGLKTVVSDPVANRRWDKLGRDDFHVVLRAHNSSRSTYGKRLLKRRGMYNERSFAHVMDQGGFRCTTLRGQENIQKRHYVTTAAFNVSLLLRKVLGLGTAKQWIAAGKAKLVSFLRLFASIAICWLICIARIPSLHRTHSCNELYHCMVA